jgi:hypothetical protein
LKNLYQTYAWASFVAFYYWLYELLFFTTDIRLRRKMPSDSPESNSKKILEKGYRRTPVAWIFFAFSNGYRHTPMPCVFSAPDIHLCHEFLLHLVNGYSRTPMPCVFFLRRQTYTCAMLFCIW